jgi:MSHA biogenesis protein MshO
VNGRAHRAGGFTLVELVVAIVLAAIIASFIVLFLDAPIQSYLLQSRRSDLVDSANRIAAAVTGDVRTALPNSLRSRAVGTTSALELLATQGVARYYDSQDPVTAQQLIIGNSAIKFATLDSFGTQTVPPRYLSVGNLGTPPAPPRTYDAYAAGNGVLTPAGAVTVGANGATLGEDLVTLSPAITFKALGAPATQPTVHNAYLVSGPVSYVCNQRAGTLMRYSGYTITSTQAVPPAGTGALIARNVSTCTLAFLAAPATYPYGQLAIFAVTLTSGGESLHLFLEVPTEYAR